MILKGYAHQVAGHKEEALLGINHRLIMKPMVKKDLFARESSFYQEVQTSTHDTNSPIRFIPKFLGILCCGVCKDDPDAISRQGMSASKKAPLPHIVLEDLTHGYVEPNVIDIKMGTCTFEPTATQQKKDREVRKYPFQSELGFRITGFKLRDQNTSGGYLKAGKPFGRSVTPLEVTAALAMLFKCDNGQSFRCDVIRSVIVQLENILLWMRSQTKLKFFCSSILVVYDAVMSANTNHSPHSASSSNSPLNSSTSFVSTSSPSTPVSQHPAPPAPPPGTPSVPTSNKASYSIPALSAEHNSATVLNNIQQFLASKAEGAPLVRVKMIDFAHVVVNPDDDCSVETVNAVPRTSNVSNATDAGPVSSSDSVNTVLDEGYIRGLQTLIRQLHAVLREAQSSSCNHPNHSRDVVKNSALEAEAAGSDTNPPTRTNTDDCLQKKVEAMVARVHSLTP